MIELKTGKGKNKKIKILLVQITNRNLGDTVIADNTRELIKNVFPIVQRKNVVIIDYPISCKDLKLLEFVDAVVFAGGGLIKFRNEQHYNHTIAITNKAEELNIPVFFNAVGVEGYDEADERCVALKNAINLPCVKGITVRDDTETLKKYYIENNSVVVESVFDPAVFSLDKFSRAEERNVIGLGVARGELFTDYGNEKIDKCFLLNFWKNIITEIEKQNREWEIFTNGLEGDEAFAKEVLEYVGHGKKCAAPADSQQLVNTITQYKSIIACRMHSCIVAHTYNVPYVGLVWNDKLSLWGKKTGCEERFIKPEKMCEGTVVQAVLDAEKKGLKKLNKKEKNKTKKYLRKFLREYAKINRNNSEKRDFTKNMVATALGGEYLKYKNMNSLSTIDNSITNGFKFLEVDLRLSEDKELVCVNGWSEALYNQLGISYDENRKRLNKDEFLKQKYYNKYKTTSFEQLAEYLGKVKNDEIKIILDLGKPSQTQFKMILKCIIHQLKQFGLSYEKFILKIQDKELNEILKNADTIFDVMMFIDFSKAVEGDLSYCEMADNIKYITFDKSLISPEIINMIKGSNKKSAVFSYKNITDILTAIDMGVDLVGSLYYSPQIINEL